MKMIIPNWKNTAITVFLSLSTTNLNASAASETGSEMHDITSTTYSMQRQKIAASSVIYNTRQTEIIAEVEGKCCGRGGGNH